jgi:hypothetical protein
MNKYLLALFVFTLAILVAHAQPNRWQQAAKYTIDVQMNVVTNQFTGTQTLVYTNHSPDTLGRVFYHLYWNAFQPGSMMDTRSQHLGRIQLNGKADWDGRVQDRIKYLKPNEIGCQKVSYVKINGVAQPIIEHETILEVLLTQPILPHATVVLDMQFSAQVPLQVRRSGRDNPETGVRYSMSQWYPKLCEYDEEGWHPTPYVAREFYGVWGDYDVTIHIDKNYVLGGTGYLQNANQIGFGYEQEPTKTPAVANKLNTLTWHFKAPQVHDFMWAAHPRYQHLVRTTTSGLTIHVLYNRDTVALQKKFQLLSKIDKGNYLNNLNQYIKNWDGQWKELADAAVIILPFIEAMFGQYPYQQYSFIHGGDGGMEYPMSTLLVNASLGAAFHEWMHTWYQMLLATNESKYAWMDEGFTTYATSLVEAYYYAVKSKAILPIDSIPTTKKLAYLNNFLIAVNKKQPHLKAYMSYVQLATSGLEEPLSTHADHFETNFAYGQGSYSKGAVFLEQLGYIVGANVRDSILKSYYHLWKFKHPNATDFIQVAEKISGMKLDWYQEYFIHTTKVIDYAIDSVWTDNNTTRTRLLNKGNIPMPIDLQISYKDGTKELHYIPAYLMFGSKPNEDTGLIRKTYPAWKWTNATYIIATNKKKADIKTIEIDPSLRLADINREDNIWRN